MTINGTTTEPIENGAYVTVIAKIDLSTVLNKRFQFCALEGVECPLSLDKEEVKITFDLGGSSAVCPRLHRVRT